MITTLHLCLRNTVINTVHSLMNTMINTIHMSHEHSNWHCLHVSGTQWPTQFTCHMNTVIDTVHMSQEHNGQHSSHVSGAHWSILSTCLRSTMVSTVHMSQEHNGQHCMFTSLRSTVINTVHISGTQWSTLFSCLRNTIINSNNMVHMPQEHNDLCSSHVRNTMINLVHMPQEHNDLRCSHVRNTMINIVHMSQEHWSTRHSLQMKEPWCLLPEILDLSLKWVWQFLKVLFSLIFQLCCQEASLLQREYVTVPSTTIYTFMPVITG